MQKALVSSRVTEDVVRKEPRPEFTKSWRPFSHAEILDAMKIAVDNHDLKVVNKEYSIRQNSKMFGTWELANGTKDFNIGIGMRNSIDKTHSFSICLFRKIFICSNFVFQSWKDWIVFRKHTGRLEIEEIVFYANEAIDLLLPKIEEFNAWHEQMKMTRISCAQASLITTSAMRRDLIPSAKFQTFHDLHLGSERKYSEFDNTLYSWHGAVTELMQENNILTQTWKQDRLNYFIDYEIPTILKHGNKEIVLDLKEVERRGFKKYQADKKIERTKVREHATEIRTKFKESKKKKTESTGEKSATKDKGQTKKVVQKRSKRVVLGKKTQIQMSVPKVPQKAKKCIDCGSLVELKGKKRICPACGSENA